MALVGLFVALLVYGLTTNAPSDAIDERLVDGRTAPAPAFSLEILDAGSVPGRLGRRLRAPMADGELTLSELRGTPVMLNFWASWCPPCREEAPRLVEGWEKWGGRGVLFLGLDMQDIRSDARAFLREFGVSYPTIRDPGKEVANRYGVTGLPETYFITARGRVVSHVVGVVSPQQLDTGSAAALDGKPSGAKRGGELRPTR
jgi:cytochrome c biogenesis protein CcmG/thiol:disulfide interchange protein DsbE